MGTVGCKPRLLTLSDDATRLTLSKRDSKAELRASVDDMDEVGYSQNIAQIAKINDGISSKEVHASLKKREKTADKIDEASRRCFTIQWRGERGAWDLEIDKSGTVGGTKLDEESAAALRDVLVGFLNGVAAVQSLDMGDGDAASDEPMVFGGSGSRAAGQKKKKTMKAGDAETFRQRKLSITAADGAELAATLDELRAEEAEAAVGGAGAGAAAVAAASAKAKDGALYLAREKKEGRHENEDVDLAADRKLPFAADQCGLFSCHGIEPKFTRTGFEVKGKINQDRGGVQYPFGGRQDMAFFAVMDGHGKGGEKISEYCMRQLPKLLLASPVLHSDPAKALKKSFLDVDAGVRKSLGREATYAGTTCVVVLVVGKEMWIANAGDSRAIVCAVDPNDNSRVVAKDLSVDHKPDLPAERARVLKSGGWVSDESEEEGPARVWLTRSMDSCGLAMARSLGDHALAAVGVIAEPEITHHDVMDYDQYLVMGSDGIWEFISSQQACDTVNKHSDNATAASETLVKLAEQRWQEEEGSYRDDITCIVAFLPFLEDRPDETYDGSYEAVQNDAVIIDSTDANSFVVEESIVLDAPEDAGAGVKSGESFAQRRLTLSDQQAEAARKIQEEAALVA